MKTTLAVTSFGQQFAEDHGAAFEAFGKVAGQFGAVAGGIFASLSRIQALLSKAAEKPYQARLLEARINSCKALLLQFERSQVEPAHLEPLRIKLAYVEDMVQRAGMQIRLYKFTDESLAKEFESASSALQEEEGTLALVVHAIPVSAKGCRSRRLTTNARRRTRSRSSSSRRSGGSGRSASPQPLSVVPEWSQDGLAVARAETARSIVRETDGEITFGCAADGALESCAQGMRLNSCCDQDSLGRGSENVGADIVRSEDKLLSITVRGMDVTEGMVNESACMKLMRASKDAEQPSDEVPGNHAQKSQAAPVVDECELPLPPIHEVERETNFFWQDRVTLVFRCAITGQEHRVNTKQWTRPDGHDTTGDRLVAWASKALRISKTWEEEMEEAELSPSAHSELKELLQNSGWYEKFEFDAHFDGGSWILKDAMKENARTRMSGYVPCADD